MHGPMEIISGEFPVLAFIPPDAAETGTTASMKGLSELGATVRIAPFAKTMSPLLDPLSIIQSFYVFVERLARKTGRDPDRPRLLRKVTMTYNMLTMDGFDEITIEFNRPTTAC